MLERIGSQVCVFSTLCWYPCCVSVSTAQCRAHTHLYITLQRTCALICPTTAIFIHSGGPACAIQKLRVALHGSLSHLALTDLETRRFGILLFHISFTSWYFKTRFGPYFVRRVRMAETSSGRPCANRDVEKVPTSAGRINFGRLVHRASVYHHQGRPGYVPDPRFFCWPV